MCPSGHDRPDRLTADALPERSLTFCRVLPSSPAPPAHPPTPLPCQWTAVVAFFLLLAATLNVPGTARAATAPLQIALIGNLQGALVGFDRQGDPVPAPPWQIPALLDALRRERPWETLVIGVGNDYSIRSPSSVLLDGRLEEALATACRPAVRCLGPADLARFRQAKGLDPMVHDRVWSNPEPIPGATGRPFEPDPAPSPFPPFQLVTAGGRSIAVLSLVSSSFLADLPTREWGIEGAENPARCLRRLLPELASADLLLVVCHLDADDLRELLAEADPRARFLLVRPPDDLAVVAAAAAPSQPTGTISATPLRRHGWRGDTDVSRTAKESPPSPRLLGRGAAYPPAPPPPRRRDCFAAPPETRPEPPVWEVAPFGTEVSVYRREVREGAPDAERWHRFPLDRARLEAAGEALGAPHLALFRKDWQTPRFYLSTRDFPAHSLYRLSPAFHACLAKTAGRSDLGLVAVADEPPGDERGLSPSVLLPRFENRFLREYQVSGKALKTLFFTLGRGTFPFRIGLAGGWARFLGGVPRPATVQDRPIKDANKYRVMMDANLYLDPVVQPFLATARPSGRRGLTLWDAWLDLLPRVPHGGYGTPIVEGDRR